MTTPTLHDAARAALDALDNMTDAQSNPARREFPTIHDFGKSRRAADALRTALAHPSSNEPKVTVTTNQAGDAVAVTLTDDDNQVLRVLWEREAQTEIESLNATIAEMHETELSLAASYAPLMAELEALRSALAAQPFAPDWAGYRQPLTEEQIYRLYSEPCSDAEMVEFARAIEAAHGITAAKKGE